MGIRIGPKSGCLKKKCNEDESCQTILTRFDPSYAFETHEVRITTVFKEKEEYTITWLHMSSHPRTKTPLRHLTFPNSSSAVSLEVVAYESELGIVGVLDACRHINAPAGHYCMACLCEQVQCENVPE